MRSLRAPRVRAPEFGGGGWHNTTRPLTLAELRGRPLLLDFFTAGCINCIHALDEIRALERRFGDALTVIGIHSPKFDHERSHSAVQAAVARHGIGHPVYNDADRRLWQQYAIRAWPTLALIDQSGYLIAAAAGEGHQAALAELIEELLLATPAVPAARTGALVAADDETSLRFPAKAVQVGSQLFVADAGHHQLAVTDLSGGTVRRRIGSGSRGSGTGSFADPNGVALLPPAVAGVLGYDVVVADTGNHRLCGVRSSDGQIVLNLDLRAALGAACTVTGPVPAVLSPWDVAWWPATERVVVAAAGVHLLLGWDPRTGRADLLAGTTVEGLRDGAAADGWLAQPSGLAVDGDRVWFVDAETSALRWLDTDAQLHTAVGQGLFEFGHVDGSAERALLQHPLDVALLPDGRIAVADTYNGAVRSYDPRSDTVATVADNLREPSGLLVVAGRLLVVESAAQEIIDVTDFAPSQPELDQPVGILLSVNTNCEDGSCQAVPVDG